VGSAQAQDRIDIGSLSVLSGCYTVFSTRVKQRECRSKMAGGHRLHDDFPGEPELVAIRNELIGPDRCFAAVQLDDDLSEIA
jgi:hypothetical protein